jgi:hypothetical protein
VVVQLGVAGELRLRRPVADDGGGPVAVVHLHAVRVELVVLELDRLAQLAPLLGRLRRVLLAGLHVRLHHVRVARVQQAQRVEDRTELLDALVRPQHDLLADRRALVLVGVEQARRRLALQHEGELPGEVVRVLDRRVGAQAVARRVPVARVAHAVHPAAGVLGRVPLVVAPDRGRLDLDRDVVVADEVARDLDRGLVVDDGRGLVDVVAPDDEPLVPRAHHAHEPQADATDVGARLQHPVQDARTVLHQMREVGLEHDVHRARPVHDALGRQPDVLRDLRAPAVGADEVLRADRVLAARATVAHGRRHALVVLHVGEVLGVEAHARAALGGVADEDRLHVGLRDVDVLGGARERVLGLARGVRAPRVQARELLAGQARAERRLAHQLVRHALLQHVRLDAGVAKDLHRALVGDVRAWRVRGPAVLRDDDVVDAQRAQEQPAGTAGRTAADDEDVGLQHAHLASSAASTKS